MRLPLWSTIASMACWMALASHSLPAVAQDGVASSTIRLTSATEPVRDNTASESTSQEHSQVAEQNPPAAPASQPDDQSSPTTAPPTAPTRVAPPLASRPRMPIGIYASPSARATLSQMPGPAPVQSAPRLQANRRGGKPFQSVPSQPTISPYMYLNAGSNTSSPMTNYFAFVRPQMDQMEASRQQQREIQQLRGQLQKMSSTGAGPQQAGSPNTAAHYMDTAQFYRGLQR